MAPFNAWPVLFLTFPVMVWLIDGAGAGRLRGVPAAAMAGWWFGLGYFVPGLYWIGYAFLVDAPTFAWLMPFAVLGLPAYLALFSAFGFGLARLIWTRDASRLIALAASLTVGEWLRGHVLTGFPWNAFGYALTEPLALSDRASGPQSTGVRDASILIWPESAFPFFLTREADAMAQIAELLPKGTVLITGSVRAPEVPPGTRITRAYNSIYVIDHDGSV